MLQQWQKLAKMQNSQIPWSIKLFMGLKTQFVKHESNTFWLQLPTRCGRDTTSCFRWTERCAVSSKQSLCLSLSLSLCLCLSLSLFVSLSLSESTRETCVMNSAPILAIQFCRFSNQGGQLVKDETVVSCTQSQVGQHN